MNKDLTQIGNVLVPFLPKQTKGLEFTDKTELKSSINSFIAASEGSNDIESDRATIMDSVYQFELFFKNKLKYGLFTDVYEQISNGLAINLKDGVTKLSKIHSAVESMNNNIVALYKKLIDQDPILRVAESTPKKDATMQGVRWDCLDNISIQQVMHNVHARLNYKADIVNNEIIDLVISKLNTSTPTLTPIKNVSKIVDMYTAAVTAMYPNEKDTSVLNNIKDAIILLMTASNSTVAAAGNRLGAFAANKDNKVAESLNDYLEQSQSLGMVLDCIDRVNCDVSTVTKENIESRVEAVRHLHEVQAYLLYNYRNNIWANAIVVPGKLINSDVWNEYNAKGGKVSDVLNYIHQIHTQLDIPLALTGIPVDAVLTQKDKLQAMVSENNLTNQRYITAKRKDLMQDAFVVVTTDYINNNTESLSKEFHLADTNKFVKAIYANGADQPLENRLYSAILNSAHVNTMEQKLYTRLSAYYTKHISSTESINATDLNKIDIAVYTDLIMDYLFDKQIIVVS